MAGASGKRVGAIAAALATAAVLGVGIGVAAQRTNGCHSSARPTALALRDSISAQTAQTDLVVAPARPGALHRLMLPHD